MSDDTTEARAAAQMVLHNANETHGTGFRLDHRFDDGFQSGAWHLTDPATGRRAVLKWSPDPAWAPRIERAAIAVAKIRAAGYPIPAWLASGTTTSGLGYQIQEFVPGRSPYQVGAHEARLLIDVLETHAGLDPDPERCWSQYVTTAMTADREALCQSLARTGPTERRLVEVCESLLAACGPLTLPTGDLVHGDFRPGNILLEADRVTGVIDIEALGSGTRVFDYATLLSTDHLTPEAHRLLRIAGEQVAGPPALAYCFIHVALDLADFVHQRNLRPGIENIGKLVEQVEVLASPTAGGRPSTSSDNSSA